MNLANILPSHVIYNKPTNKKSIQKLIKLFMWLRNLLIFYLHLLKIGNFGQ